MSFRDYLHEKAEESRHNETLAYLMFVAGAVFLVGGILTTLSLAGQPSWFLVIPYNSESGSGTFLALLLVFSGVALILFGLGSGVLFSHERGWYMQELRKASSLDDALMQKQTGKNGSKKRNSKT